MKKLLLLCISCTIISFSAFSQVTYLADTAFTTDVGAGGAGASCIFTGGDDFGWTMNRTYDEWSADAFTIPADSFWSFDTVIVYGYQFGSGTTSTILDCNLEIYNGAPGLGGNVIWGDTTTNVLVNSGWTGIYRVDTGTLDGGITGTDRPIMYLKLYLSPAAHLPAGTYWLAWSAAGSLSSNPSSPERVLPGRINPTGQQARRLYDGIWSYVVDESNDIGFNKIIKASAEIAAVPVVNKPVPLNQNEPNPFNSTTTISFYMPQAGYAKLAVYNTIGQLVTTLMDGDTNAGIHNITFNADKLMPGIYYYRLSTDAGLESKEMLLIK